MSFRPLSGSYISQSWQTVLKEQQFLVSVPYRGAIFLNTMTNNVWTLKTGVSVPYRGAIFLNRELRAKGMSDTFPSPIGELYFSIGIYVLSFKWWNVSFRPLSGSYISQ